MSEPNTKPSKMRVSACVRRRTRDTGVPEARAEDEAPKASAVGIEMVRSIEVEREEAAGRLIAAQATSARTLQRGTQPKKNETRSNTR